MFSFREGIPCAKRIETAEPPEPLIFQHSEFILFKQILQRIDGPAARHYSYYYSSFSCFFEKIFMRPFLLTS